MNYYRLKPNVRMQYTNLVPFGKTLEECVLERNRNVLCAPFVIMLSRHASLLSLNLTASLVVEGICRGKSTQEIGKTLIYLFAKNREEASQILSDESQCILELLSNNWITEVHSVN